MNTISYGDVSLHLISIGLSVLCLIITLKNQEKKAAKPLASLLIFAIIASFATFMELSQTTYEGKLLWRNIMQIGLFILPAITLNFVRVYTGNTSKSLKWVTIFSFAYQIFAVILIFTNSSHFLMRESIHLVIRSDEPYLLVKQTLLGKGFGALNTLVNILTIAIMGLFYKRCSKNSRSQVLLILLGLLTPALYSYIKLALLQPMGITIPTATSFLVGNVLILWGFLKHDLLSVTPLAKDWAFNEMRDGLIMSNTEGRIIDMNATAETLLNSSIRELNEKIKNHYPLWYDALEKKSTLTLELPLDHDNRICEVNIQPLIKNDHIIGAITHLREVTNFRLEHSELLKKAERDGLTELFNRMTFEKKVNEFLKTTDQPQKSLFLLIDIDYFKSVNDTYGHLAGDNVLQVVANQLVSAFPSNALIGRLGGTNLQFLLLMTVVLKLKNM